MYRDAKQWRQIRRSILENGAPKKKISRETGISRKTINKILTHKDPPLYGPRRRNYPKLGPYIPRINQLLIDKGSLSSNISIRDIVHLLRREQGFSGSYDSVRNYVRHLTREDETAWERAYNLIIRLKAAAAESYRSTYDNLLKRLCRGCLLHVDETSVSVQGVSCYVWVLASLEEVAYFYTSTREGDTIQALLKEFSGVLVSDFYAAYDAINCPQQKCLIHFIRDLNGAILKHPYDVGLKRLASDFAGLLKPMVETVDRRGLKKRFLGKHRSSVHRFYNRLADYVVTSEAAEKLVSRLQKNRNKMFTFLDFDDVPWNNNNAEHAVKAFASVRRVIEGPTTEKGLRDFLVLLSVCETCKCKNVDFLEFLRSGAKDIDDFANSQSERRLRGAHQKMDRQSGDR